MEESLKLQTVVAVASVMPEPGEPGGTLPPPTPQYLADQLTLFQPWGADSAHHLLVAPLVFFTFQHHWASFPRSLVLLTFEKNQSQKWKQLQKKHH